MAGKNEAAIHGEPYSRCRRPDNESVFRVASARHCGEASAFSRQPPHVRGLRRSPNPIRSFIATHQDVASLRLAAIRVLLFFPPACTQGGWRIDRALVRDFKNSCRKSGGFAVF
jgi:hypothetical protein